MAVNSDKGHSGSGPGGGAGAGGGGRRTQAGGAGAGGGRRTQAERSARTRAALVAEARRLFAEKGYAGTGREEIVEAAGVTRGALYHHYANKEDLFRAVYEELERETMEKVAAVAVAGGDPLEQLRLGTQAYLDIVLEDRALQRVVLIDAPSVLGWEARHEIAELYVHGMVREVLRASMEAGIIREQPVEPLTHVLLAGLHEAALYVARAADPVAARAEVGATVDRIIGGL